MVVVHITPCYFGLYKSVQYWQVNFDGLTDSLGDGLVDFQIYLPNEQVEFSHLVICFENTSLKKGFEL